jgi:hypothetical protein
MWTQAIVFICQLHIVQQSQFFYDIVTVFLCVARVTLDGMGYPVRKDPTAFL